MYIGTYVHILYEYFLPPEMMILFFQQNEWDTASHTE